jgi:hypothetical protein
MGLSVRFELIWEVAIYIYGTNIPWEKTDDGRAVDVGRRRYLVISYG